MMLPISIACRAPRPLAPRANTTPWMRSVWRATWGACVALLGVASSAVAADITDYERDVAPVLMRYCAGCHTAGEAEADLVLDSWDGLQQGGEHGPVIDKLQPERSLLLARLTGAQKPVMPPEDEPQPSAQERATLVRWIQAGAPGAPQADGPQLRTPRIPPSRGPKPVTALDYAEEGGGGKRLLVVRGRATKVLGMEVTSKRGLLVPVAGGNPEPFQFLLKNTKQQVVLGNLQKTVDFDGELVLPIAYRGEHPAGDVVVKIGDDDANLGTLEVGIQSRRQMAVGKFQEVELRDPASGRVLATFVTPGKVNQVRFSEDGSRLVAATGIAGLQGEALVWDVPSKTLIRRIVAHRDTLYAAQLSPDGKTLATASYDRRIMLHDLESGDLLRTLIGHNGAVYDVAFSPDGKLLASASADATVKIWDVATGERFDTLGQPLKEQYSVDISPDGKHVIAAGEDNRIRMWRLLSRERAQINPLEFARFAHQQAIHCVRYSGDGQSIVSAAKDQTVKVWAAETLVQQDAFRTQDDSTQAIAVAGDSNMVSIGRRSGAVEAYSFVIPQRTSVQDARQPRLVRRQTDGKLHRVEEKEPNNRVPQAQRVSLPALVNGKLTGEPGDPDVDSYRFSAKQGETWVFEVNAARNDGLLDSHLAIYTDTGVPVPRVQLQAVRDSYFTFRGKDSNTTGDFRLHNWEEMQLNQLLYAGGEVVKLYHYPRGPDSGFNVYPNFGSRRGYFDTTPLAHALHEPCYIVEPHPPGARLAENGLPVFVLNYENDDDSQRRLGKDSRLTFVAPKDGEYVVVIRDVRGLQGDRFGYELAMRPPTPDFRGKVLQPQPEVARGNGRRFGVEVERIDGFDGPITIRVEDVPPGFRVLGPGTVEAGHDRAWAMLWADEDAVQPEEDVAVRIIASGVIDDVTVEHELGVLGKITLKDTPQLRVRLEPDHAPGVGAASLPVIEIRPGTTTTATIRITREGHDGRVGFGNESGAHNAQHGIYVDNIGLNGVLIVEGQQERQIFLTAESWVPPSERVIFVEAGEAGKPTSNPVILRVLPATPDRRQQAAR